MSINLTKGQRIAVGQTNVTVGLGWSPNTGVGEKFDLDCSVFLLDKNKMLKTEEHFVFFNNLKSPCGSVQHSGDDTTGMNSAGGDDEQIKIDISTLDPDVTELLFVASIHSGQNFGRVRESYIRIVDNNDGSEIAKYELDENFSVERSIEFGRLYKFEGVWKFDASGIGYDEDLSFFVEKYYSGNIVK
jgi:tellurium resistance protein TerD